MGDSGNETDSADESLPFLNEIPEQRDPPESPPLSPNQLVLRNALLAALLSRSPDELPPGRHSPDLMFQIPNDRIKPILPIIVMDDLFSSNDVSSSRNSPPFRPQLDQSNSLLVETIDAHEPSTPRNPSEEPGQLDRNESLLSLSRNRPIAESEINIDVLKGGSSTPRNEPATESETKIDVLEVEVSTHRNRQATEIKTNIDLLKAEASTPRNRPTTESETNVDVLKIEASSPRNQPATENETNIEVLKIEASSMPATETKINIDDLKEEASISRLQPLLAESGFSFDDQPSCGTIDPSIPIHTVRHPIYATQALLYLQVALRQITQFNEENNRWRRFSLHFLNDTGSSSKEHGSNLEKDLLNLLADMKIDVSSKQGPNIPREMTMETYSLGTYETLTSMVVSALAFALTIRSNQDFDGLIFIYVSFRGLYDTFSRYWENKDIEGIEDEASRNHLKALKKIIERLLLDTETAFRLLLMYIGANSDEEKIEMYEKYLSDEDKKDLRKRT